jgi:hypothetical protein
LEKAWSQRSRIPYISRPLMLRGLAGRLPGLAGIDDAVMEAYFA